MSVSDRVREIEMEIDASIRQLPTWTDVTPSGLGRVSRATC